MASITMTAALRKRKMLKLQLDKGTKTGMFVSLYEGDAKRPFKRMFQTESLLNKTIKAQVESVADQITYYHKLVAAIIKSNAETTVTVAGVSYTVADAIERRNSIMLTRNYITRIKNNIAEAADYITRRDKEIDTEVSSLVERSKTESMDASALKQLESDTRTRVISDKALKIADPCGLASSVDKMEEEYQDFCNELEDALNISNAVTLIEV